MQWRVSHEIIGCFEFIQQKIRFHHITNRVHQPPSQASVRCFELTHMDPVPNWICLPSRPSSSPSSMSTCPELGTGNRGNGRRETKPGNNLTSCKISGFVRSGDVQTRKYCSSASSYVISS